jgi:hypothetical protein
MRNTFEAKRIARPEKLARRNDRRNKLARRNIFA